MTHRDMMRVLDGVGVGDVIWFEGLAVPRVAVGAYATGGWICDRGKDKGSVITPDITPYLIVTSGVSGFVRWWAVEDIGSVQVVPGSAWPVPELTIVDAGPNLLEHRPSISDCGLDDRYPHKCPHCGGGAYIPLVGKVECKEMCNEQM